MFSLFKKKYGNNTILKMYRVVTKEEAFAFDSKQFIDLLFALLYEYFNSEPTNYYVTGPYPDRGWKTKKGFLNALERKKYKNICHLILSTELYSLSFENWLLNYIKSREKDYQALEFSINERLCDSNKMELFYKNVSFIFPSDYAFIFLLPMNYMPSTESKIKRGFGSFSVEDNPKERIWQQFKDKVDGAILKDIYPLNFINDKIINSDIFQKEIISKNVGSLHKNYGQLSKWILDVNEIQSAKENLRNSGLLINQDVGN